MLPSRDAFLADRIETSELRINQGATMFKVIARYAPTVAALGMLTSGSFGVSALEAEQSAALPTVTVRYADLDLNTSAGAEELYARLRTAARHVCNVAEARALGDAMRSKACYQQVLGAAVNNVKSPMVDALHRAKGARDLS
jgi:UrcA family protein